METQTVINIPFNKLVRSEKNVRVVNPDISADRELIASIRANGVLVSFEQRASSRLLKIALKMA